jgi:hypothetical protein
MNESSFDPPLPDPQIPTEYEDETNEGPPVKKHTSKLGRKQKKNQREIEVKKEKDLGKQCVLENYVMGPKPPKIQSGMQPSVGGPHRSSKK